MYLYDVTCSVVAYNTDPAMLKRALSSFLNSKLRSKVVVVDNSDSPALRGIVESLGAEYLFPGKNLGFGCAHNLVIRRLGRESRFHLVLNPDVYFEPSVLETLHRLMLADPGIGVIAPRMLFPDGRHQYTCRLLPTPFHLLARRFLPKAMQQLFSSTLERSECRLLDLRKALRVPFMHGCFLLLRTDALLEVGGFDGGFFLYMEDIDLCRRILTHREVVYFPGVSAYHEFEKGSYFSPKLLLAHLQSAFHYFNKWGWFLDPRRREINRGTLSQAGQSCDTMMAFAQTAGTSRSDLLGMKFSADSTG